MPLNETVASEISKPTMFSASFTAWRTERTACSSVNDQAFSYSLGRSEPDTDYLSFLETGISFRHNNGDFARAEIQHDENFRLFVHYLPLPS